MFAAAAGLRAAVFGPRGVSALFFFACSGISGALSRSGFFVVITALAGMTCGCDVVRSGIRGRVGSVRGRPLG